MVTDGDASGIEWGTERSVTLRGRAAVELEPYETIENPVLGHEYRLLERGSDEHGEFLRIEGLFRADSVHFDEHVHVEAEDTWTVLSGEFDITVDGTEHSLGPGEGLTMPKDTPHFQRSAPGTEVRVLHELRPPVGLDGVLRSMARLAQAGKTAAAGRPDLLQAAVVFDTYPGTYETGHPIPVQKRLFGVLAIVGRLQGTKADYATNE